MPLAEFTGRPRALLFLSGYGANGGVINALLSVGDQCLIDETIAIARSHDAWVMIDNADGMGVHGSQGIGLIDPQRRSTT